MTTTVVIDLGMAGADVSWDEAVEQSATRSGRGWGLLAILLTLSMLTTGAPPPAQLREVARLQLGVGQFQIAGDVIYLMGSWLVPNGVSAVDAGTGKRLWQYRPTNPIGLTQVRAAGDTAVLAPDPCISGGLGDTVGVHIGTGAERWRRSGVPLRGEPDSPVVVVVRGSWSDRCGAIRNGTPLNGTVTWTAVDRDSGVVRWQVELPERGQVAIDADPLGARWAALLDAQGLVFTLDLRTGARSASVGGIARRAESWLHADRDVLYVTRRDGPTAPTMTIAAYDRSTLVVRWSSQLPAAVRRGVGPLAFAVRPCAALVCVTGDETVALDPRTGAVVWRTTRAAFTDVPGGLLADYDPGGTGGGPGRNGVFLHDPVTGQVRVQLPSWRLLGVDRERQRLLLGMLGEETTAMAWLGVGGGLNIFGVLPGRFDACQTGRERLVCHTNTDDLWLLHPSGVV